MRTTMEHSGLVLEVRRGPRRKTFGLTVDRAGELVVHVPVETSEAEIQQWVRGKALWIHGKLAQKQALVKEVHPPEFVSGESIFYLGYSYRLRIVETARQPLRLDGEWFELRRSGVPKAPEHFQRWYIDKGAVWLRDRCAELERLTGQTPSKVVVANLGFRWGSCGKNGTLYFNWRLLQLPVRIIDYVVVHEQMHMLHADHSPRFWGAMDRVLPDWRQRRDECEEGWSRYARFATPIMAGAGLSANKSTELRILSASDRR